ncbi:ATP-binding cassette [Lithospermum erythrorhizon]|uniref:ATP-binding cassette n=1 Tax=Lithospermum erythrorhizon TaxID=34254 RepID=A0AAV3QXV5_LITER
MRAVHHYNWWFGMIQDLLLKYLGSTVVVILIIEPFFSGALRPDSSTLGRAEMLSNLRYHTSVTISLFQSLGNLSISSRRLNRLSGYAGRIWLHLESLVLVMNLLTKLIGIGIMSVKQITLTLIVLMYEVG